MRCAAAGPGCHSNRIGWLDRGLRRTPARNLLPRWNDDVLGDLFIHRVNEVVTRPVMKGADDSGMSAFQRADDAALSSAIGANSSHFDQDPIAMHRRVRSVGSDVDISADLFAQLRAVRDYETVTI